MFRHIHDRTGLRLLLSGLVLLAMLSDAAAWVFCPYMVGSSHRCGSQNSVPQARKVVEGAAMDHSHCTEMQMSEMDLSNMEMDDATTSEFEAHELLDSELINPNLTNGMMDAAITQSREPCSHCIMHSRFDANSASRAIVVSSSSCESCAGDSAVVVVIAPSSLINLVEIHDHGPPGSSNPHYLLNNTFRI
jgi:hypothetical protein